MMNQYARIGAPTIAADARCRVIARYGVGVDIVDVEAATAKGILVTNVRDYCTEEVADHAIALWLALARKLADTTGPHIRASGTGSRASHPPAARTDCRHRVLRQDRPGDRGARESLRRRDLVATTRSSRRRLRPPHNAALGRQGRASRAVRRHLHAGADDARNAALSGASRIRAMKPGAIVVNTGRGPTIDNRALYDALVSGKVSAAGLDDPEEEPAKRASWSPAAQSALLAAQRDRHAACRLLFGGIDPPRARDGRHARSPAS